MSSEKHSLLPPSPPHKPSYEAISPSVTSSKSEPSRFRLFSATAPNQFNMPTPPPLASLRDTYTTATCPHPIEHHPPKPSPNCHTNPPQSNLSAHPTSWWTPNEMSTLIATQSSCPPDHYHSHGSSHGANPPSGPIPIAIPLPPTVNATAPPPPSFTTTAGLPVYLTPRNSPAEVYFDGYTGVTSSDPLLHMDQSGNELIDFLHTWNTRPRQSINVHGYHTETRERYVTREEDGERWEEREYYTEHVTDFDYSLDITNFIFPFGYITSLSDQLIPEVVDEYLRNTNPLKELVMYKQVQFDFDTLEAMITGHLRAMGWYRGLTISFPQANHRVRVYPANCISKFWESCCGKLLCYASVVGCCVINCIKCSATNTDIVSNYRIEYHPLQVFEDFKHQLWCPSMGEQIIDTLMSAFW